MKSLNEFIINERNTASRTLGTVKTSKEATNYVATNAANEFWKSWDEVKNKVENINYVDTLSDLLDTIFGLAQKEESKFKKDALLAIKKFADDRL